MLRQRLTAAATAVALVTGLVMGVANASAAHAEPHGSEATVQRIIDEMTLEEKVGQLFVLPVYGKTADTTDPADVAANQRAYGVDNAEELIAEHHPGGIIYYSVSPPNVESPKQVARLSNGIQRAAMKQRVPVPLLLTTDQEQGGVVSRIPAPFTQFPGSMALGATGRPGLAYTTSWMTGTELRAIGINQNYGPVADVNVNPANPVIGVRSFGADPTAVARFAAAQVGGYQAAGIASTAKHFPGHGDTNEDSHTHVPKIEHTKEEIERIDLPPFKAAIKAGIDSIMTAHIIVPALDPSEDPATLSKPIMTGVLRERLGYDGVVVTDALGMAGVREKYGDDRIPVLALQAGVDQLLKPPDGVFQTQFDAVVNAVRTGELTEERIEKSVARVLRLKMKRGLFKDPYADEKKVDKIVGNRKHAAAEQEITDRTTTLVKNDAGLLPLSKESREVLVTGWGVVTTQTLADKIAERGGTASAYQTGINPGQTAIDEAVARAEESDLVVVTTNRAGLPANGPGQKNLVKALVASGTPVIVVAVRDAYDIAQFTEVGSYLATYGYTPASLESAVRVLFGERNPRGRLPVMIPTADDPDETLYPLGHGLSYK